MNGKELFNDLKIHLKMIGLTTENYRLLNELISSLSEIDFIDEFHQIRKNDTGEGLALEILMFNEKIAYDLVITKTRLTFTSVLISKISSIYIESQIGQIKNEGGDITEVDNLKFSINYAGDYRNLVYFVDTKRFSEINRIRKKLLSSQYI